ncbi:MAG: aminoacyl-tRNA hydrolase [Kiritimatiellae bacterium]|nr:aminoacyl-tRNA hydrolase [Kiritimatiellia bacterium]MBQ3343347.1 aminoacyl-tRNA hydrolase [Kiritimatiellia bacterium]
MKIIAGLGNPGPQYADTPHSVGFEAVDAIAASAGASWEAKRAFNCLMARCMLGGQPVLLVKPQTFMNLSGESVAPVVKYHNATPGDLVVVQDDIDLPVGRLRIRVGGSCGGHNGVRNIIERLGTGAFARVKIGVGKDGRNVIGHVLGKFDPATRGVMDLVVAAAAAAVEAVVRDGPERAMNAYNGWTLPAAEASGA